MQRVAPQALAPGCLEQCPLACSRSVAVRSQTRRREEVGQATARVAKAARWLRQCRGVVVTRRPAPRAACTLPTLSQQHGVGAASPVTSPSLCDAVGVPSSRWAPRASMTARRSQGVLGVLIATRRWRLRLARVSRSGRCHVAARTRTGTPWSHIATTSLRTRACSNVMARSPTPTTRTWPQGPRTHNGTMWHA